MVWELGLTVPSFALQPLLALPQKLPGSQATQSATARAAGVFGRCEQFLGEPAAEC